MNQLNRLKIFVHVVEEMSFAAAARKLKITNAAVSKQVMALENELKMQLIYRTTRKLELTEVGKIYFEHAKRMVQEMREMESLFYELKAEPAGHLKIGSSWHFAKYHLAPHLEEFLKLYPKVTLEILIIERVPDLAKEGFDLNIGNSFVGGPDDIHKKVYEANYGFYASPDYLKRFGIPENPEDLVWHRYITHRNRNPDNVLKFRNKKEIKLKPFLSIDDSRTMIECAKQGLGIIKLHSYAVAEALQKKELVEILESFDDSIQPIYLCYQPRRYIQPKIRHFIDFFCAKFAKKPNTNYQKHL